jgi:bifunctional non-homologous end joining protein LigD
VADGPRVGALLLGFYEDASAEGLTFAGAVGSGLGEGAQALLAPLLRKTAAARSPFIAPIPRGRGPVRTGMAWVKPSVAVQVEYRRWFEGGLMQQAAYKGIRLDKSPREIVRATVRG